MELWMDHKEAWDMICEFTAFNHQESWWRQNKHIRIKAQMCACHN